MPRRIASINFFHFSGTRIGTLFMRLAWVIAVIGIAFSPATVARADENPNAPVDSTSYGRIVKLACVGDSITEGVGTSHHRETSWPAVLGRMLGEKWAVGNFGSSGRTLLNHGDLPYQTKGALKKALAFEPDVVVILLGTNDTKPQNWKFKDEFVGDYNDLIGKFRGLQMHPQIFICQPPLVVGAGNYKINEDGILAEIPMIEQIAKDAKTGLIDIHSATADHPEVFPDRVHPNDAGAAIIAKTVFKAITGADFVGEIPATQPAGN
jgi:acyl-CoA thioesterase-1